MFMIFVKNGRRWVTDGTVYINESAAWRDVPQGVEVRFVEIAHWERDCEVNNDVGRRIRNTRHHAC